MRILEITIPSNKRTWKVQISHWFGIQVEFYVSHRTASGMLFWDPVRDRAIPKSIMRRARYFFADPERFGRVRYL